MDQIKILQFGDISLSKTTLPLQATKIKTKENKEIIKKLLETTKKYSLSLLTAPQIDINKRIIIICPEKSSTKTKIIINPYIKERSEKKIYDWEKCSSINNNQLYAIVPRHEWITLGWFDQEGKSFSATIKGLESRLIQHGIDHLNGLSYFERMRKKGLKFISSEKKWRKEHKKLLYDFVKSLK